MRNPFAKVAIDMLVTTEACATCPTVLPRGTFALIRPAAPSGGEVEVLCNGCAAAVMLPAWDAYQRELAQVEAG